MYLAVIQPRKNDELRRIGSSFEKPISIQRGLEIVVVKKYSNEISHVMAYSRNCNFSAFSPPSKCTELSVRQVINQLQVID